MDLRATPNLIHLVDSPSGRQSLQLEPARGQRVIVIAGKVWVTQAGDFKDYVLRQGEALTLDSPGMAVGTYGTRQKSFFCQTFTVHTGRIIEISIHFLEFGFFDGFSIFPVAITA